MTDPLIVEVTRGNLVESRHAGAFAIVDADGALVASAGEVDMKIYPRSAIKALQALPVVESGAADAVPFGSEGLAMACSSHNAERRHLDLVERCLSSMGFDSDALECGVQMPARASDRAEMNRSHAAPTRLHNNCSGKHMGFLGLARALNVAAKGYSEPDHPVQREVKAALEQLYGRPLIDEERGQDGCSIPTYAVPLRALAFGMARFGSGQGLGRDRAAAALRLRQACLDAPFYVAGTHRFCTDIMAAFKGRVFVKTGAEGVFCGYLPELGVGIALKCLDGATRASEAMMAALIEALLGSQLSQQQAASLSAYARKKVLDRNANTVGYVTCSADIARSSAC